MNNLVDPNQNMFIGEDVVTKLLETLPKSIAAPFLENKYQKRAFELKMQKMNILDKNMNTLLNKYTELCLNDKLSKEESEYMLKLYALYTAELLKQF